MSEATGVETFQIANFRAGAFFIGAHLDRAAHAIATVHEDLHGIVRRSTPYGAILRVVEQTEKAGELTEKRLLPMLVARCRTSEEVFATHGSLMSALKHGPDTVTTLSIRKTLAEDPEYGLYSRIGHELVGSDPPAVAAVALDALARFCWSAKGLPLPRDVAGDLTLLRHLDHRLFPDARLGKLRKLWTPELLKECLSVVKDEIREFLGKNLPPLSELLQIPPGTALLRSADSDAALNEFAVRFFETQGMLTERSVLDVYNKLVEMFHGSPLEAMNEDEIREYVANSVDLPVTPQPTGYEFPEVAVVRPTRRQVVSVSREEVEPHHATFIRLREDFDRQVEWTNPDRPAEPDEAILYLGWNAREVDYDTGSVPIHFVRSIPKDLSLLSETHRSCQITVTWASLYLQSPDRFGPLIDRQANLWIVCDVQPGLLVSQTRDLIPELRLEWIAPDPNRPNVGVMIAPRVGDGIGLDGLLFPGSAGACNGHLVSKITSMLGDDLRGVGPVIVLHDPRRHHRGRFLASWLVKTERNFHSLGETP